MSYNLNRRELIASATATLMASALPARGADRSKKEFMQFAIAEIDAHNEKIDAAQKELSKKGGPSPLFVKIPKVIPFGDWDYYYLESQLKWTGNAGESFAPVTAPKGFVTDLASVPSIMWAKYPPMGRYAYAAIVHDYLYWTQTTSREDADKILSAAMKDANADKGAIDDFYIALRLAGGSAWNRNAAAKKAGEKRVLARFPSDPLVSWETWKKTKGVFASM